MIYKKFSDFFSSTYLRKILAAVFVASLLIFFTSAQFKNNLNLNVAKAAVDNYSYVSSYVGGSLFDRAQGTAVDANGNIYLAGNTTSTNLPVTTGAFDRTYSGGVSDGWVAKLSPDAKQLLWLTYLGGSGQDRTYTIKIDNAGFVYVSTWTESTNFPVTAGAFDTTPNVSGGSMDIAITKMKADGTGIVWSTFIGGSSGGQSRNSMYVDSGGNVYLSGQTSSTNFPTTANAYSRTHSGGKDAFALKLSASGSQLLFSTFIGGSGDDDAETQIAVSPSDGSVFIAGTTNSTNFPTTANAIQRTYKGSTNTRSWLGDMFISKFSSDGSSLVCSTYLGGTGDDGVSYNDGLALDPQGNIYVIGEVGSTDIPVTANGFQKTMGGVIDHYIAKLSPDCTTVLAASYFGGAGYEEASGFEVDSSGDVYFSGNTTSSNFVTTANAISRTLNGTRDAYFVKMPADLASLKYSSYIGGSQQERGREIVLDNLNNIIISGDTDSANLPITSGAYDSTYAGGTDAFVIKFIPSSSYNRSIQIDLEGVASKNTSGSLEVYSSNNSLLATYPFTSDSAGNASVSFSVPSQLVKLKVIAPKYLKRTLTNVDLNSSATYVFVRLLAGDLNQDNIINSIDFSSLNSRWFQSDATKDLNSDGLINTVDFSLMNKNWFMNGDT